MSAKKPDLFKAIALWGARGKSWVKDGQALGLEVLAHVAEHRQVGIAKHLIENMPKGTKRNAMVEWLIAFGPLALNEDPKTNKDKPFLLANRPLQLENAKKKPWYEFQPEAPIVTVLDAYAATRAALDRIIKQVETCEKNGGVVEHRNVADLIAEMQVKLAEVCGDETMHDGAEAATDAPKAKKSKRKGADTTVEVSAPTTEAAA